MRFVPSALLLPAVLASASDTELRRIAEEAHLRTANVGYQLQIAKAGEVVFDAQFGERDRSAGLAVQSDTQFLVMSVTKTFTGAALVKAMSAGSLAPSDLAAAHLADFGAVSGRRKPTIADLASHVAGAPHRNHPERRALYDQNFPTAKLALAGIEGRRWKRRGRFSYSSGNYMVLAAALEAATGQSFMTYMRQTIIEPLGLNDTGFSGASAVHSKLARNYSLLDVWNYKPVSELQLVPRFDYSFNQGGGGMISSARDLVRFGQTFVGEGFFSSAELDYFTQPIREGGEWSYGWILGTDDAGRKTMLISGATIGVMASLLVIPEEEVVAAAIVNCWCENAREGELIFAVPRKLIDVALAD